MVCNQKMESQLFFIIIIYDVADHQVESTGVLWFCSCYFANSSVIVVSLLELSGKDT